VVTAELPLAWIGRHSPSATDIELAPIEPAPIETEEAAGVTVSITLEPRAERISEIVACRELDGIT